MEYAEERRDKADMPSGGHKPIFQWLLWTNANEFGVLFLERNICVYSYDTPETGEAFQCENAETHKRKEVKKVHS
jgi:hypothetical protein